MSLALKHVLIITLGIVLVVAIVCSTILIGIINGNNQVKSIQIECIQHGGSYIGHTCVYPTVAK